MDTCQFLDSVEDNFETGLAPAGASFEQMGKLLDACVNGTKLAVAFNLTSQLSFGGGTVSFPSFDVSPFFKFSLWGNYSESLSSYTYFQPWNATLTCPSPSYSPACTAANTAYTGLTT